MAASTLQKVLTLSQKAGFVYKSAGGGGGLPALQYGPLGAELKRNIVGEWWHAVITSMGNVFPMDAPIGTTRKKVKSSEKISLDQENSNKKEKEKSSLLLRTHLNHVPLYDLYKKTLKIEIPFGIAEVGKVFRPQQQKEGTAKTSQEVEVGVVNFFCSPSEQKDWSSQWRKMRLKWWKKFATNPEKFTLGKGEGSDDLLGAIEFPEGARTLETMVTRKGRDKLETCVITMSTFIDNAVSAYLFDSFTETFRPHEVSASEKNTVMRLDPCLAPYKVAVIPKINDVKLNMYCKRLAEELRQVGIATATWRHSYEQELTWQNEVGTPFRILGTEKTLETGTVLLQDRDTTLEEEMNGRDVLVTIQRMLLGAKLK